MPALKTSPSPRTFTIEDTEHLQDGPLYTQLLSVLIGLKPEQINGASRTVFRIESQFFLTLGTDNARTHSGRIGQVAVTVERPDARWAGDREDSAPFLIINLSLITASRLNALGIPALSGFLSQQLSALFQKKISSPEREPQKQRHKAVPKSSPANSHPVLFEVLMAAN